MFSVVVFFFFNDPATTEIYTLSLHDALPIFPAINQAQAKGRDGFEFTAPITRDGPGWRAEGNLPYGVDRKSTRLNSSHANISYAVFCLKKKKQKSYRISFRSTSSGSIKPQRG